MPVLHTVKLLTVMIFTCIVCISFSVSVAHAQSFSARGFELIRGEPRLRSNFVTDILITGAEVWFGTGRGPSRTTDGGATFENFGSDPGIGKGGAAAITYNDGVIWVSTGYDTTVSGDVLSAGSGLSRSDDHGATWHYIPQPVDPNNADSLGYNPTTTNIQNITYDIAVHRGVVWIASWGGGLRRSTDNGATWEVVTPDGFPFAPLDYLNHIPFSIVSTDDELYVGTAQGINRSTDGGETWTNFRASNSGVSGNFVTAMAANEVGGVHHIWAATWTTESEGQFYGVSVSTNGGLTWTTMLEGERVHNFGFEGDNIVYAVSDNGLFRSYDRGKTWGSYPYIRDNAGNTVYSTEFYSVAHGNGILWVGTSDGLVKSSDGGMNWNIIRAFKEPGVDGEPEVYAYPNPFSPARHNRLSGEGHVRIQYSLDTAARVTLDLYDFGMNPVRSVGSWARMPGPNAELWDGKNDWGRTVANGVYFYRLSIEGKGEFWGKIIVMN